MVTSKGPTRGQGYRDPVLEPAVTELFAGGEVFVSVWVTGGLQHPKACLGT